MLKHNPLVRPSTQPVKRLKPVFACLLLLILLASCAQRGRVDVDEQVRDPSSQNDSLIQVKPMIPDAVRLLLLEADQQISEGLTGEAILTLQRALNIAPGSALVQQHLAEAFLSEANYQEAMYWSTLVVNQGPDQGALCERSRRTQALAAELLGLTSIQAKALDAIASCTTQQRPQF